MQRTCKSTPYKQSKFTGYRLCRRPLDSDGRILRGFEPSVGPLVSPLAPPINQIYEDSMDLRRFPGRVSGCLDFGGFRRSASPPLDPPIHQIYEDSIDLRGFPGRVSDRLDLGGFRRNPPPPLNPLPLRKCTRIYDDSQAECRTVWISVDSDGVRLPPPLTPH